ncbi:MAG: T9SS type A sorting domain-containing protein [Flavobacteriales bacterium]|nr:T9SS type A sorting domain-containing protein [Flavobacteriales bacterium]
MNNVLLRSFFLAGIMLHAYFSHAQISIHQEESELHSQAGLSAEDYEIANQPLAKDRINHAACNLNKVVYGWHPYWSNGLQSNYDWSLLSHLCYFSYELDASTGNAISTHSFSTAQAVTDALANGVRVDLCVTLFSNHATFLTNTSAKQTLINNLISLISSRGAHGVNIDFEGLPAAQATNFRNFMNDLSNQMHAAIPGSQVSTVLYSVDWNNALDVANMSAVDYFIIMGYDYYYSGSTTAGPNDPLYQFSTSYNYTLSKSVTYYLDKGVPTNKLVLGLPYYGREWATSSNAIPSSATASGVSRTFTYVKTNSSGFYSTANRHFENESISAAYVFNNSGWRQCFITEGNEMEKRLDFINKRGIAGMGIWALGYDDGYNDFWNAIANYFTDCYSSPCSDTLTDIGGGRFKNYYDKENYTYTISPPNATSITLTFSSFNLENNYDFLYVYDGPTTASPQVSGSPFTGTSIPAAITSSGGHLTLKFTSDGATTAPGFVATYQCTQDNINPVTQIQSINGWKTSNFNCNFTDTDQGSGVNQKFWQVMDNNGSEWRANATHGFFNDNFDVAINSEWTNQSGIWNITSARLNQSDEAQGNGNLYTSLTQDATHAYLYHWQANMGGSGNNRRSGLHFFCDNPSLTNRGNSYFVYFRVDNNKCQIYEVVNDVFTLMTDDDFTIAPSTWYDYKITYDPSTGEIKAYVNNVLASQWTDPSPLQSGNSISIRTGNTNVLFDDLKVYKSRSANESITIGNVSSMVRYQNNGPANPSCRIRSIINDHANNWSNSVSQNVNIDWTPGSNPAFVNESISSDIDTTNENLSRSCNWGVANDAHSGISYYEHSIGLSPGDSSVHSWSNAGNALNDTITGLLLNYGTTYYVNVRSVNGAGLKSTISSSDGFIVLQPADPAIASFIGGSIQTCSSDSLQLFNTSTLANGFYWSLPGLSPSSSTSTHPNVMVPSTGNYTITLIALGAGGNDTLTQNVNITLVDPVTASFSVNATTLYLPNAFLALQNTSNNATSYYWDFGDSTFSSDSDPWHEFTQSGIYDVWLYASNGVCPDDSSLISITVLDATQVEENSNQIQFSIYPNPATELVTIRNNNAVKFDVELYSIEGKLVIGKNNITEKNYVIQEQLAKGIYLLNIKTEHSSQQFKLIIE